MSKSVLDSFLRDSSFVYLNKFLLLVIGIYYTYLIANFLGPEAYGSVNFVLSFVITILNFIGMYTILKLNTIFIAKKKSKQFFLFLFKFLYLLTGILILIVFFFPDLFVNNLGKGTVSLWQTSVLFLLVMPASLIFNSLLISFKSFGKILRISVYENFTNLFFAFVFVVLYNYGVFGVIYARVISLIVAVFFMFKYYKHLKFEEKPVDFKEVKEFAIGSVAMNWAREGLNLSSLWALSILSNASVGIYYLLEKFVSYFVKIPLDGLVEVLVPYTAEKHDDINALNKYTSVTAKFFLVFSIIFGIIFTIIAHSFIDYLFPDFTPGPYLIPLFFISNLFWVNNPFGVTLRVLNKTKMLAVSIVLEFIVFVSSAFYLISIYEIEGMLIALILSRSIKLIYYLLFQGHAGLNVQIIPTYSDLKFFYIKGISILKGFLIKNKYLFYLIYK